MHTPLPILLLTTLTTLATNTFAISIPSLEERNIATPIANVQWKVSGFTRPCTNTICTYNFTINVVPTTGPIINVPCLYNDTSLTPPTTLTPQTHSYSALSCSKEAPTLQINWGYSSPGDFAVMTIVDNIQKYQAFL